MVDAGETAEGTAELSTVQGAADAPANRSTPHLTLVNTLWEAADRLRGHLEAAEYKHLVLGLVFLKSVGDGAGRGAEKPAGLRVPDHARWSWLRAQARTPEIGILLDAAMDALEGANPCLVGALPKVYARAELDSQLLADLVELIGTIGSEWPQDDGGGDVLGRVYEYFLGRFAALDGRLSGEFYTPQSVVRLLVDMIEPFRGSIYDPCCGSGGMFVQSSAFVAAHGGARDDLRVYGQESVSTTWRLARMNLALRGINADLGERADDVFHRDHLPDLRADYVLANPPFNSNGWYSAALRDDARWVYGLPPKGNANFAWVQHIIHHLAPKGVAAFVLANGSLSARQSGEGEIRRRIVEASLVDCVVALPAKLFLNTAIPACLWIINKDRAQRGPRQRRGEVLFIDARSRGRLETRSARVLDEEDVAPIVRTYHAWHGRSTSSDYEDVPGWCRSVEPHELRVNRFVLTPGRFIRPPGPADEDDIVETLARLRHALLAEIAVGRDLEVQLTSRLTELVS